MSRIAISAVLAVFLWTIGGNAFAWTLRADAIGAAGGSVTGGAYRMGFTAGLTPIGRSTNATKIEIAGFWRPGSSVTSDAPSPLPMFSSEMRAPTPNPFRWSSAIHFTVPSRATPVRATLQVFDVHGRRVATLVDADLVAGPQRVDWNGRDDAGHHVPSGLYLARLELGSETFTQRLARIR